MSRQQKRRRGRGEPSRLYQWSAEREQRAVDAGGLGWSAEAGAWDGDRERLARFRRREPVDIWATGLPAWTGFDRSSPSAWARRVTVYPDGQMVFRDDVGAWLRANT
jgi:hypothetical protein